MNDKTQMIEWFGQPYQTIKPLSDHPAGCVERWQWTYAHSIVGGSTMSDVLIVDFDAVDKVCDNAFSQVRQ